MAQSLFGKATKWGGDKFRLADLEKQFEKALHSGGSPDLDAIDKLIQDSVWIEYRVGRRRTRELEVQALDYMVGQVKGWLDPEQTDLESISMMMERPVWQCVHDGRKAAFESQLLHELEGIVEDLTSNGRISSAFRRIEFFFKALEDRVIFDQLQQKIDRCREIRMKAEAYFDEAAAQIAGLVKEGRIKPARAALQHLKEEAPNYQGLQKVEHELILAESGLKDAQSAVERAIEKGAYKDAYRQIVKLNERYPEARGVSSLGEEMAGAIMEKARQKATGEDGLEDPAEVCAWIENYIADYQELFSLGDLARRHRKIYQLFGSYAKALRNKSDECLLELDLKGFERACEKIRLYQGQNIADDHLLSEHKVNSVAEYEDAVRNNCLESKCICLSDLIAYLQQNENRENCRIMISNRELSQCRSDWQKVISFDSTDESELASNLEALGNIASEDGGILGERACSRVIEIQETLRKIEIQSLKQQQRLREDAADWPGALEYIKKIKAAKSGWPKFENEKKRLQEHIYRELAELKEAEAKEKEGLLDTALEKARRLAGHSHLKIKANALVESLEAQTEKIKNDVETIWQTFAADSGQTGQAEGYWLCELSPEKLADLAEQVRPLAGQFKDAASIQKKLKQIEAEYAARGRLEKIHALAAEVNAVEGSPTIAKIGNVFEKAREGCRDIKGYRPLVAVRDEWAGRIREKLLDDYQLNFDRKHFTAARQCRETWQQYLDAGEFEEQVQEKFGRDYAFSKTEEPIADADTLVDWSSNYINEHKYEKAAGLVKRALKNCGDHPKALDLKRQLADYDAGIDMLREVEKNLVAPEGVGDDELDSARVILDKVKSFSFEFKNLKKRKLKWDTLADYERALESRSGVSGKLRFSIGTSNYMLFAADAITLGSPKDDTADLVIQAPFVKANHCSLKFGNGEFALKSEAGACYIADEKVDERKISEQDEIRIGKKFKLTVDALKSGAMVLSAGNYNQLRDFSLSGVILMQGTLTAGSESGGHIVLPGLKESFRLIYRGRRFYLQDSEGERNLSLGSELDVGGVPVCLSR